MSRKTTTVACSLYYLLYSVLYSTDDVHCTAAGAELVAQCVTEDIEPLLKR